MFDLLGSSLSCDATGLTPPNKHLCLRDTELCIPRAQTPRPSTPCLLLTGIQSAPRNRVGCSGEDFWDVSLGCSSFLWCGTLGSLQHIRMTFCPASCLTKRATRKHRQIDPFRVQQLHPTEVRLLPSLGLERLPQLLCGVFPQIPTLLKQWWSLRH